MTLVVVSGIGMAMISHRRHETQWRRLNHDVRNLIWDLVVSHVIFTCCPLLLARL